MQIEYVLEPALSVADFVAVLRASTLAERRPVDDEARLASMLKQADIIYTARDAGQLVGVARAISDFTFVTYVSDLAVDEAYQGQGIGRQLLELVHAQAPQSKLYLVAAPKAQSYYPHIGMQHQPACYFYPPTD